jgi:hypothetical protein
MQMKKRTRTSTTMASWLLTCAFALPGSVVAAQLADDGAVSVQVLDGKTARPVAGAAISLQSRDGQKVSKTTDDQGRVKIDGLPVGLYEVRVSGNSYQLFVEPTLRVSKDKTTPIAVELLKTDSIERIQVNSSQRVLDQNASAGTSYLTGDNLTSAVGSGGDVLRALDGLPGLFSSGEFSSFTVRGRGPKDNLILVDEIPFQKVVHFDDSFGDLEDIEGGGRFSVFAPNVIGGAEFQPGGWSPAYGGGAASLLKLNVAEGNNDSASYSTRLDLSGLEVGYDGPSRLDDDTSLLFSARRLDFGRVFETVGVEDIGTPKLTDIIVKTTTQLGSDGKLNVLAIYAPETFERNLENALASDEDDPGNWEDLELATSEADNSLLAISYARLIGSDSQWTNRVYIRDFGQSTSIGEAMPYLVAAGTAAAKVPVRENILSSSIDEREYGWRSDFVTFNDFGQLDSGLMLQRIDVEYQQRLNDAQWIRYVYDRDDSRPAGANYIVLTPNNTNSLFRSSATNASGYVNQTVDFGDWNFRAGARLERDGITGENLVSPRFGTSWLVTDRLQMTTTAGIYYQPPAFDALAADNSNQDLKNERTVQLSVGWKYALTSDIELLFEPYYQQLSDLLVKQDGVEQTLRNSGEGYSWGVDTVATKRFSDGWSLQANYSYNKSRVKDSADTAYYVADFNRPHFVQLGGIYELDDRWSFSARWKWASGAPRDGFVINQNVLPGSGLLRYSKETTTRNIDRYDGFSSVNFRADYRRQYSWTELVAFVDIINLLGSDNPSSAEFNERTGLDVVEDGESIILLGFKLQW